MSSSKECLVAGVLRALLQLSMENFTRLGCCWRLTCCTLLLTQYLLYTSTTPPCGKTSLGPAYHEGYLSDHEASTLRSFTAPANISRPCPMRRLSTSTMSCACHGFWIVFCQIARFIVISSCVWSGMPPSKATLWPSSNSERKRRIKAKREP